MSRSAMLSRSGNGSPFGKRTREVRSAVSERTGEALEQLWRAAGYGSESEYVAIVLDIHCFGQEEVARLHANRVLAVARKRKVNAK